MSRNIGVPGLEHCGKCKYWKNAGDESHGRCLRFPPQVYFDSRINRHQVEFPKTHFHDWCGEYSVSLEAIGQEDK